MATPGSRGIRLRSGAAPRSAFNDSGWTGEPVSTDDAADAGGASLNRPAGPDSFAGHPLIARLSRIGQRLRHWDARHRWVLDASVVLVMILWFCAPDLTHRDDPPQALLKFTQLSTPTILLLQAGLVLPLWWRRRAPLVAFHVIAVVFLVQWSLNAMLRADVALLVALYSLVLHGRLERLPWAAPILAAALGLVAARVSDVVSVWDALFFLVSAATAAAALGFAVRLRRAQLAALRDRAVQLEIERDQRSKLAAANERTRVAREMHDIVGHSLSVIITLADGGAYAAEVAPERGKEALHLIGDTGRRALSELRRVLGVLRDQADTPDLSPQPGVTDINPLCDRIRAAGPQVEYHTAGDVDALDVGVQLAAYRIVQEALTNTLKHAGADTHVHLTLSAEPTRLRLLVRDTGPPRGTNRPTRPGHGAEGHGLIGMRERAALYGGTVIVGPTPDGGWAVEATLDLAPLPEYEGDLS
jgi:signal transduction histidine kinase